MQLLPVNTKHKWLQLVRSRYKYQWPYTHATAAPRYQGSDPLALFNNRYTVLPAHIFTPNHSYISQ